MYSVLRLTYHGQPLTDKRCSAVTKIFTAAPNTPHHTRMERLPYGRVFYQEPCMLGSFIAFSPHLLPQLSDGKNLVNTSLSKTALPSHTSGVTLESYNNKKNSYFRKDI